MRTIHWLNSIRQRLQHSRSRRGRYAERPVESLEDRVLLATFSVSNTADFGDGSLRKAIEDANAASGPDTVEFSIVGTGPHTISLQSALPVIGDQIVIDGWSQPGHVDSPLIVVNGANAGIASGLEVRASNSIIRGLVIQEFQGDGIIVSGASGTVIQGNHIGTNAAGTIAVGNSEAGIRLLNSSTTTTTGNDGVVVTTPAPPATASRVAKASFTAKPQTVEDDRERNVISGNKFGIVVEGTATINNSIQGNYIGTDVTGQIAIPNSEVGISFIGAGVNTVGGVQDRLANVISGNGSDGIQIDSGAQDQAILGNYIGVAADGVTALGNGGDGIAIQGGFLQGSNPAIVYTLDVSGSTSRGFSGSSVGDVNSDGRSDTILDAELAGFIAFTQEVLSSSSGSNAIIGIVAFGSRGVGLDMDPSVTGIQLSTTAGADKDGNGTSDVIDTLRSIKFSHAGAGGGTSFVEGIAASTATFQAMNLTGSSSANLVFVSDGAGNASGIDFSGLDALGVKRQAVGIGSGASLIGLQTIDPNASRASSTNEFTNQLLNILGSGGGGTIPSTNIQIGGTVAGSENIIAHNAGIGISVGTLDNPILGNSIHSNGQLGIDLLPRGVNSNDAGDTDRGPNNGTNFPTINDVTLSATGIRVDGFLGAAPNTAYRIEAFGSATADSSGYGQGERFLSTFNVTTDASGRATFREDIPTSLTDIRFLSMTATDPSGNTSEFSEAFDLFSFAILISDATANESDGSLTFTVSANKPIDIPIDVEVQLNSDTALAGVDFDATARTITIPANSTVGHSLIVPLFNDSIVETLESFTATLHQAASNGFRLIDYSDTGTGTITDDDVPGFTVTETNGSTRVSEDGITDTFSVVLNRRPASGVTIEISSSDIGEATPDVASLRFTTNDWDVPQTVTALGVDDGEFDGDQVAIFSVQIDRADSDPLFGNLLPQTVSVTNLDDDIPDVLVTETGGTTIVGEPATGDSFHVVLGAPPATDVVLTINNSLPGEVSLNASSLTFTPTNWDVSQVVSVVPINDFRIETTQQATFTIAVNNALSSSEYSIVPDRTVVATVLDDDGPGLSIIETDGATVVVESGSTDTFDVLLRAQPVSDVVVTVASQDTGQAGIRPASLTFTPTSWNVPQTVTVTGVDNDLIDGSRVVDVVLTVDDTSSDADFAALPDRIVMATVVDDDGPGFSVTESGGNTIVDESGTTDEFLVVLTQMPNTDVALQVGIGSSDEISVNTSSLTFTSTNWNIPQPIVVTGVDDFALDGDQLSAITISVDVANSDDAFDQLVDAVVAATTVDDDEPTFTITETDGSTVVTEAGTEDVFQVFLNAQPTTDVVLDITSSDLTEATIDTSRLVFTPTNWMTPRTVTVIGLDDPAADGDQVAPIVVTVNVPLSDNDFDAAPEQSVAATVLDDDVAGVTVTETGGSTNVSESGTQDSILVKLDAQPLTNVVISVISLRPDEATVDKSRLTFTPGNWNTSQTVSATGTDDSIIDGQQIAPVIINVVASDSDAAFGGVFQQSVDVSVADDDLPGFVITETQGFSRVSESGQIDTFSVVLTARPASDVVLNLQSLNENEVTLDRTVLRFTPHSWNVPRVVTLQGQDDSVVDGATISRVEVSVDGTASDADFASLPVQHVNVTNVDDDVAGFLLLESDFITNVDEFGLSDQLEVVLRARPTSDVVFTVTNSDTTEATVDVSTLTFTPAHWNIPQVITVTGADDDLLDGNDTSIITVSINRDSSNDKFRFLPDQSAVSITDDNDQPGILLDKLTGSVNESGSTDTFAVSLTAAPIAPVVLDVRSEDPGEVDVDPVQLTFDTNTWNIPQVVTVSGVPDNLADGNQSTNVRFSINVEASHSAFDGLQDQIVIVQTVDGDNNDRPFVLSPVGPTDDARPTLRWSFVPGAVSYELRLTQVGVTEAVIDTTVNGTSFILSEDLTVGRYRTQVTAVLPNNSRTESDTKTFDITASVTFDNLPFFGDTPRPQFSWASVPGATGYRIQINNTTTGELQIVDEITNAPNFTPTNDLTFGVHNIWVRPIGPGNVQSLWDVTQYYVGPEQIGPRGTIATSAPQFSWAPVAGAATYQIYVVGPGGLLINESGITGTTFTAPTSFATGDFRWWLRPSTATGATGAWSEAAEFSTGSRTKVSTPRGTINTAIPVFSWPSVPDAESYEIYVSRAGTPGALYRQAGLSSTTYQSPVLTAGDYKVWIRSTTPAGRVWGSGIAFTVETDAVSRFTTPISPDTPGLATRPQFSWRPTSETASYDIYLHNGETSILQTGLSNLTWTPDTDLAKGEWTWSIRPQTATGAGQWSVPLSFNTSGQSRITRPTVTTTDTTPLFRWQPVAGATRYVLQVDNLTSGTSSVIREDHLTDISYQPSSALTLGSYRVWIRAINSTDIGQWSQQVDFDIIVQAQNDSNDNAHDHSELMNLLAILPSEMPAAEDAIRRTVDESVSANDTLQVSDSMRQSYEDSVSQDEKLQITDELMAVLASDSDWL